MIFRHMEIVQYIFNEQWVIEEIRGELKIPKI
jgi:hypothetical protein